MNRAARRAIRSALAAVEDDLYRYQHFGKPTDVTGNGVPYSEVIAGLERDRDALLAALEEASDADE